ncbi:MAG: cytochrome c peroxidase [Pseudohongiellaceae bacterium]|nr:cytochrome c peroxidase [Pseudohongiellaceae bacterium]
MRLSRMTALLAALVSAALSNHFALAEEAATKAYQAFLAAKGEAPWINANASHSLANDIFRPIPELNNFPANAAKRDLGFSLFHDKSLSSDDSIACNTCHMGMKGGTDGLRLARGIGGAEGTRNTPTIFNSAFNFRQFWDGRAFDLDQQSLAPLSNPVEMGHDLGIIMTKLEQNTAYVSQFNAAYPDGLTERNLGNAIAQHSKDMTRTDSPFNDYLNGDTSALSTQEIRGKQRFDQLGCTSCHNGINLGGNSYQAIAAKAVLAKMDLSEDLGVASRSQRQADAALLKVPQLHNIALTAPYFHDGSVTNLEDAIRTMAQNQAGRTLAENDVNDIAAFLRSLSSQFFNGGNRGMNQEQMRNSVRQQMPDKMPSEQHKHQHHMMHTPRENSANAASEVQ